MNASLTKESDAISGNLDASQIELGEALKASGTAHVLEHNEEYRERFFAEAQWLLGLHGEITSEDVISRIGLPQGHPSAVGACLKAFAKLHGLRVYYYRKARRPSSHAAVIGVWQR